MYRSSVERLTRVAADGAPRSPGGASHVTGVFGAEDEWGCPRTGPAFGALQMIDTCHWCAGTIGSALVRKGQQSLVLTDAAALTH